MQMTMYMALDALADFSPVPEIQSGETRLTGPQFSGGANTLVLREQDGGVVLTGGSDRIRVPGHGLFEVHDALTNALAFWNDWERRMMDAAAAGTLQSVTDAAFALFDDPILITDARDRIVAITPHPYGTVNDEWDYILEHGSMPTNRLVDIYRDPMFRRASMQEDGPFIFNPPGMMHRGINMRFQDAENGSWLGIAVIIEHKIPISIGKLHLARSFYDAIALHLRLHPAAVAAQAETRLLSELMDGAAIPPGQASMLAARLFPDADRFVVAVLRPSAQRPPRHAEPMLEQAFPGVRCLLRDKELCVLLPDTGDVAERLDAIAVQADAPVGLSRPFSDWSRMAEYRRQARVALETGGERVNELSRRSVSTLCEKVLREQLGGLALSHPALALLADYDARRHTALLPTLRAFLTHERNLVRTARALYIHRNSLVYRIRRIQELTALALDDPEERLYLLYSFAILDS